LSSIENQKLSTGWKRHTGVLEGTPSSEAALWGSHNDKDAEGVSAMRYFNRTEFEGENVMSRKDAVVLAARTLAAFLTVWALTDVSY
jgi:hypothetical protein